MCIHINDPVLVRLINDLSTLSPTPIFQRLLFYPLSTAAFEYSCTCLIVQSILNNS
ncbi:hypothetical protein PPIS_a3321 [Pseudoalteromonas piscicida]|uniref:Uncharacterized protein n=1 Tax=Pseudoalteromonas piscicida TaxID=43662 RepID=A0ABM6NGU1_PSEO7|nr:hypothetical protein PPIS_a3321 [Pseudoalteromonas piscicida]